MTTMDEGVELSLTSASPSASEPVAPALHVVRISTVQRLLSQSSAVQVLEELSTSSDHLTSILAADERVALVSYRQEKRCPTPSRWAGRFLSEAGADESDDFTLDGFTLVDIVAKAHEVGVTALWLDAWCYRFDGEYEHLDFCKTLHTVLTGVSGVIWLPRSKQRFSRAQYAFRLWCTFEAACVQHRNLPVVIAGLGRSRLQHRLTRWGSYTPGLWSGDIASLCRINLFFYLGEGVLVFFIAVAIAAGVVTQAFLALFYVFVIYPLIWLSLRASLGQQVRLAKNAYRVLRTMQLASRRPWGVGQPANLDRATTDALGGAVASATQLHNANLVSARLLLRHLPWLPAYDRRDSLVVAELLGRIRTDLRPQPSFVHAIAFSAHVAARLDPSAGDGNAHGQTLRTWLAERDISLKTATDTPLSSDHEACHEASGPTADDSSTPLEPVEHASAILLAQSASAVTASPSSIGWLDGDVSSGKSRRSSSREERLPMLELRQTGWKEACGATPSLVSPLGNLVAAKPPCEGNWAVGDAKPTHRPRLGLPGTLICVQLCNLYGGLALLNILQRLVAEPPISPSASDMVRTVLFNLSTAVNSLYFMEVWRTDLVALLRQRIMPTPFLVFNSNCGNAFVGLCICGSNSLSSNRDRSRRSMDWPCPPPPRLTSPLLELRHEQWWSRTPTRRSPIYRGSPLSGSTAGTTRITTRVQRCCRARIASPSASRSWSTLCGISSFSSTWRWSGRCSWPSRSCATSMAIAVRTAI